MCRGRCRRRCPLASLLRCHPNSHLERPRRCLHRSLPSSRLMFQARDHRDCPHLSLRLLPRTCRLHHRRDGLRRNLQSCHCQRHHSHLLTCQHRNRHRHRRMCLRQYRHRGPQRIQLHCRLCSQLLLPPRNQRLSPRQHQRTCQLRNLQNFPRHSRRYCQRSSRL